jgi:hypothetical protein
MNNIIERYIERISKDDINSFLISKDIHLNETELDFTYNFIKKNYKDVLNNPTLFDINRYSNYYTKENFSKITKVYQEYFNRYSTYL